MIAPSTKLAELDELRAELSLSPLQVRALSPERRARRAVLLARHGVSEAPAGPALTLDELRRTIATQHGWGSSQPLVDAHSPGRERSR